MEVLQSNRRVAPSGLEKITEGGNTGWRLVGADPANFGDIGDDAVDLSISNSATATRGATGHYATAVGLNTISSGGASFAGGQVTEASGSSSFAFGWNTKATQNRAVAFGTQVHATGESSFASGSNTVASGTSSFAANQRSHASGSYSFCGGYGESVADYAVSSGTNSSVFSHVQAGQGHKEAAADDSAILGGRNNEVAAGAQQAAVIGGGDVSATQASTVYVPSLVIGKGTYQQGSAAGIAGELGHIRVNGTALEYHDGTAWKVVTLNP